ncbi:MAG: glycosyltransferase family 2 protein, partial [Prevotella sp.]|nr:glycosyltransferase family 2 protein [Prevotella sp.]
ISNINNGVFTYGGMDDKIKHRLIMPDVTELKPCATFNGNIVLIPIKVFEKIGYNDNFFHHSFGDIEYGLRATKRGLINYIAPGYYGYCQRNNPIPPFRRKSNNIIKRYKLLYSPLGANPFEAFYLNIKYYPWYKCFWLFIKLHLNVLFTVDHKQFEE